MDAQTALNFGRDGLLYVFTDRDAPRARVCVTDPATPQAEHWRDLIPQDPEAVLSDFAILDDLDRPVMLVGWTRHAISEISVHDLRTGERVGAVPTPGLGTIGGITERPEGGYEAWFGYTDNTTPPTIQRYDARTGETTLWAASPGAVEVPDVTTEQVVYRSADGAEVHMLVISPPGAEGPRPTILYGYGGFGISMTPATRPRSWPGWRRAAPTPSPSCAAAASRGGVAPGRDARPQAERLRRPARGGRAPDRGGRHHCGPAGHLRRLQRRPAGRRGPHPAPRPLRRGGLLGPAAGHGPLRALRPRRHLERRVRHGRRPRGVRLAVVLLPYHHVKEGVSYPATLFTVFQSDTRVHPLHAWKMCAALQHAQGADRPILLRNEAEAGHGARAVSKTIELAADQLAFLAHHTGLLR
nr:hypothetical protein GCM10020093_048320 [Planobispora longispora]